MNSGASLSNIRLLCVLFLGVVLGSCGGGGGGGSGGAPPPPEATWLVMVYMAGDNNLEESALFDINLMEYAPASAKVKTVVQVDTLTMPVNGSTTVKRLLVQHDTNLNLLSSTTLQNLGEINTASPVAIQDFVTWATASYPSDRYVLILWDHGGQWSGWGTDDTSGTGPLTYLDLKSMFANIQLATGIAKFDIIGFDACLMAAIEVDYMLSPFASYRVGSCESEMGGWNFADALTALAANPSISPADFGQVICDTFIDLKNYIGATNQTQSVVALTNASNLATAIDGFAVSLNASLGTQLIPCIAPARRLSAEYGKQQQDQPGFYIDLRDFADRVATTTAIPSLAAAATGVLNAVDAMVTYHAQGSQAPNHRGISIYFPNCSCDPKQIDYPNVDLATVTQWDEFIASYQAALVTDTTPPGVTINSVSSFNVSLSSPVTVNFTLTGNDIIDVSAMISYSISATEWVILGEVEFGTLSASTYNATWDATVFALTDGVDASFLPAWSLIPNSTLCLAIIRLDPVSGPSQDLIVILDLNWPAGSGSFLGFYEVTASGTLGSRQINEGDILTVQLPVWDTTTQTLSYQLSPASITVPAGGTDFLSIYSAEVPNGTIDFSVFAEDYAENFGVDSVTLTVP